MKIERIAVANEELDRAEMAVKDALAEIDARYRLEADPWIRRLADIEGMREYHHYLAPATTP
jgi:hypothetical protein